MSQVAAERIRLEVQRVEEAGKVQLLEDIQRQRWLGAMFAGGAAAAASGQKHPKKSM